MKKKNAAKKKTVTKKKNTTKKVVSKKKPAATRIVPVNMQSEKRKLDSSDVEGQSAIGDAIRRKFDPIRTPWACAAVRG